MRRTLLALSFAAAFAAVPAVSQTVASPSAGGASAGATGATTASSSGSTSTTGTSTSVGGGSSSAFGSNSTSTVPANNTPAFGPGGSFSNDSGNSALGTSAGQTSSGTAVGNSSAGIDANGNAVDGTTGNVGVGPTASNPDGTVPVVPGVNSIAIGGRTIAVPAANTQASVPSATPTPLFDQAARDGMAKERERRARGEEPRVYGIAPRTENDLSHQMPDDPLIRY